jgi:outer membrane immunogenic protein
VVGSGIDYKLRENVSLGVEALYYSFEDHGILNGANPAGEPVLVNADLDRDFFTVRARLTYHFGGDRYSEPLK